MEFKVNETEENQIIYLKNLVESTLETAKKNEKKFQKIIEEKNKLLELNAELIDGQKATIDRLYNRIDNCEELINDLYDEIEEIIAEF